MTEKTFVIKRLQKYSIQNKRQTLYLGFLFLSLSYSTSIGQTLDSVIVRFPDSLRARLSYTINWDARSSIIREKRVNIWGVNTGIIVGKKRHQVTFGYYWLNFNSYQRLIDLRKRAAKRVNLDYYTKTDLYFFSLMHWQNFINNKRWQVSMPIEIGIGATKSQNVNIFDEIQIWRRKDYFMPIQAGLYVGWKATRWGGLSVQGGYRFALYSKNFPESYNGLYYSWGANMRLAILSDLYNWVIKNKKPRNIIN
ncbi:hypothetical protein Emtol_3546 [Emticicia oligotrophica DSM 17448]|uniref:DUF2490 domain-containing protein n=1 Tax=Emticicia oligotrophica (strain DSM 17448 / CIP 109782 / MTCC 6937 / GPTSA100-15) TaxID=929562 RepID=A0ABN4AR26_EMTOG|nr:hypothetical protein Emtol_3546 [Emticicia oligotrophica DSM 17448]